VRSLASELRKDRLAAVVIRIGGVGVIAVVLAMVAVIASQAIPLFVPASVGSIETVAAAETMAVGVTSRGSVAWWLEPDGGVRAGAGGVEVVNLAEGAAPASASASRGVLAVLSADGRALVGTVRTRPQNTVQWAPLADLAANSAERPWRGVVAEADRGEVLAARWNERVVELTTHRDRRQAGPAERIAAADTAAVKIAPTLDSLALIDQEGSLRVRCLVRDEWSAVAGIESAVTAAAFLPGGRSLVAGSADGAVVVIQQIPRVEIVNSSAAAIDISGRIIDQKRRGVMDATDEAIGLNNRAGVRVRRVAPEWRVVRRFAAGGGAISAIAAGSRGRSFAVGDLDGSVAVFNATSGRLVTRDRWTGHGVDAVAISPRSDALVAVSGGNVLRREVACPHPEISLRTLFMPVWYEGLAEPRTVWQTSGGSDGFQPKYSLWPLILGTLKATFYAMLVSIPLALLAALYVSQLAPGWLQSFVKPTVEMMAAVPTVVVGFLAALWLAPRLEIWLFPAVLAVASIPLAIVLVLAGWRVLPATVRNRVPEGAELLLLLGGCGLVVALAALVAGPAEQWLFDGDAVAALFVDWGIRYEQRNSIIVGVALGFAVIPVIFTIAEDACSAVSPSLVQAARALGATRWQAAIRLVAPAASPGLLAAVMLGLGRAVGETMIVLMAAGNTPVLDFGPFSGMRTMSAAMAFEIPEAAVGGTLFRVLFLTGFLLFVLSFLFTTAADLVSRRLRRRHARV